MGKEGRERGSGDGACGHVEAIVRLLLIAMGR